MPFASKSCFVPLAGKGAGLSRPHALSQGHEKHFSLPSCKYCTPCNSDALSDAVCNNKTAADLKLQSHDRWKLTVAVTKTPQSCSCNYKSATDLHL